MYFLMQGLFYSSYLIVFVSQCHCKSNGKTVSGPSITAKQHLAQDSIYALSPQEIVREDVSSLREIHRL